MVKPNASKIFTPQPLENENIDHAGDGLSVLAQIIARFHASKCGQSMVSTKPLSDTSGVKTGEKA